MLCITGLQQMQRHQESGILAVLAMQESLKALVCTRVR
jgi:hypothetical protein